MNTPLDTVSIEVNISENEKEFWKFNLIDYKFKLVEYSYQVRETKRHKFKIDYKNKFSIYDRRNSGIKIEDVPLPEIIIQKAKEILKNRIESMQFEKWMTD